jgi:ABC-type multidrug transport system fused ATPase/permease subunit
LIRPEWQIFALGTLGSIVLAVSAPLLPLIVVQPLFDGVLGRGEFARLPGLIAAAVGVLLVQSLAMFVQDALYGRGAARFAARVRATLYRRALEDEGVSRETSSGVAARTALDIRELELFYMNDLTSIVGQGLSIFSIGVVLFVSSPTMTLLLVAVFLPVSLLTGRISLSLERSLKSAQDAAQSAATWFSQSLEKRELLKSFRVEERFENVFAGINRRALHASSRRTLLTALGAPLWQLGAGLGAIALLAFAANEVQAGRLTLAGLTAYVSLLALALGPAQIFARGFARLSAVRASAKALGASLEASATPEPPGLSNATLGGDLTLEGVRAAYPDSDTPALEALDLQVKHGETLAVIGSSGSGKTTLTRVLLRHLEPTAGTVTLGGILSSNVSKRAWRAAFAFVPQAAQLMPGTVRENLTLFGEAEEGTLWATLERVGLADAIRGLPQGLETLLGENGAGVSGGQAQRLAIARALLTDAPILILDEPTSSLDAESETLVRDTLHALKGEKTTIVIAHRLSTVQHADHIAVLEGGRVTEYGTPAALLERAGRYAALLEHGTVKG